MPSLVSQQHKPRPEKRYRGLVSGRGFRLAPGTQVEFSQTESLSLVDDQRASKVQMVDKIEDPLLRGPSVPSIAHQAAESQMNKVFTIIWNQGVSRLLNTVVQKRVSRKFFGGLGVCAQQQSLIDSLRQPNVRCIGILLAANSQCLEVKLASHACRKRQRVDCSRGETPDLTHHQVDHVSCDICLGDRLQLVNPSSQ